MLSCVLRKQVHKAVSNHMHRDGGKPAFAGPISATGPHLNSLCSCGVRSIDIWNSKTEGDSLQCSERRGSCGRWACICASCQLQYQLSRGSHLRRCNGHHSRLTLPECSMACIRELYVPRPTCGQLK